MNLIAGLLMLAHVSVGVVPAFPYTSYGEMRGVVPDGPVCQGTAMRLHNDEYVIYSTDAKDIFVHSTDGEADFVYFAKSTGAEKINIIRAVTIDEAKRLYPMGPCPYFSEVEA